MYVNRSPRRSGSAGWPRRIGRLELPWTTVFGDDFRARTPVDVFVFVFASVAFVWIVARLLGDAHYATEEP